MRAWHPVLILAVCVALLPAGCDLKVSRSTAPLPDEKVDGVELTPTTVSGLQAAMAKYKGSVVLMDFWATWCGPCRESFPEFVGLHERFGDLGLVCVSVSIDDPDDQASVLSFLKRQRAAFPNYIRTDDTRQALRTYRERFGLGDGIPSSALFARNGERVWSGHPGSADLARMVEDELAKK